MATGAKRRKRSSGAKNNSRGRGGKSNQNGLRDEVILLLILAISVLFLLSNFGLIGAFGDMISDVMFGLFGLFAYIAPIVFFIIIAFGISNKGNRVAVIKVTAAIVLFLVLCAFLQILFGENENITAFREYYTLSSANKEGGGIVGGILSGTLIKTIDIVGTYVVLIILMIVCVVLITEKSFLSGVKKGSSTIYNTAREDAGRRKEIRAVRKEAEYEERRRMKEEQVQVPRSQKKVRGVAIDTKLEKEEATGEDIHEVVSESLSEQIKIRLSHPIEPAEDEQYFEEPDPSAFSTAVPQKPAKSESAQQSMPDEFDSVNIHSANLNQEVPEERPAKRSQKLNESTMEKEKSELEKTMEEDQGIGASYRFPSVKLLTEGKSSQSKDTRKDLLETAKKLQTTLGTFGVKVTITDISQGPTVTRYEMQPEMGVKVSKIVGLSDDIKLNLAATDIRIEAPIPGKAAVGIEIPNKENMAVMFRELIESKEFKEFDSNLAFAVGKDISGKTVVTDIAKMPHLLIAGATGSGKSVCINTLIMSLIYKAHPDDVKLIMIDPKVVELSVYNKIPHLLIPVVTDPKKAAAALHWGVVEMTERYKKFADYNVRDLKGYNRKVKDMKPEEGKEAPKKLPQIVIIVDELADLMMVAPGDVEEAICRLVQLARAAGIHLIIATQRPSVDVITGLIKANMPSRIAFSVSSGVDSRTILDMNGAEKLLGKGDMLFYPQGYSKPARIQGAFISDQDVGNVVDFLAAQFKEVRYSQAVSEHIEKNEGVSAGGSSSDGGSERDTYFIDAAKFIIDKDKASIGMLQRVLKIGFNRAARIMDQLADAGVV
ncbi:MAG: DNA translocase FtsK, partial [Clostridia bacterium]|nr:DNA translocase FtsK [Clostridia bacterium]